MKRSVHLEPLSHDHFEGLHVARRLRAGLARNASAREMAAFVVHFWDAYLVHHFRQEEEFLVEPLERTGGAELAARMIDEHRALGALVDAMREPRQASSDVVEPFAATLPAHIRFEERVLFPHLERRLDPATLEAVGDQLRARHVEADLSWPVPFWT